MLGKIVGKGDLAILSNLEFIPKGPECAWDCCDIMCVDLAGKPMHLPRTSHDVFRTMLQEAASVSESDPELITHVLFRR